MSTVNLQQRLNDLFGYIRQGKIVEAMNEFYAKDTKMQESAHRPTVGLEANIEREKQFMSGVKEWKGFAVTAPYGSSPGPGVPHASETSHCGDHDHPRPAKPQHAVERHGVGQKQEEQAEPAHR